MFTGIFIKLFRSTVTFLLVVIIMGTNTVLAQTPIPSGMDADREAFQH